VCSVEKRVKSVGVFKESISIDINEWVQEGVNSLAMKLRSLL